MHDPLLGLMRVTGFACVVGLLGLTACGSAANSTEALGSVGSAGAGPSGATSLTFSPTSTLTIQPGQTHLLKVVAQPAAAYQINFALLGDPKDASLNASEITASRQGVATVQLTAPTSAAAFSVRASIGTRVSAVAAVSVSLSFGTLLVTPSYAGKRAVWQWTATARTGITCAALPGIPPPDGDLIATAAVGGTPSIADVPIGPSLAVTLRAGYYIGGCADVQLVSANGVTSVVVPVNDRPIQLSTTDLDVTLGVDGSASNWQSALQVDVQKTTNAMIGNAQNDVSALLNTMYASASDPSMASEFQAARVTEAWDQALFSTLGGYSYGAATAIRSHAQSWLSAGAAALVGPNVFAGHLNATQFQLNQVGEVSASAAGVTNPISAATWSADAGDTVLLKTKLSWMPSKLLSALALGPAQSQEPGVTSVPQALARILSCQNVAQTLEQQSTTQNAIFPGCDTTCAETLCAKALGLMWQRAKNASAHAPAVLDVSASGQATVDEQAEPASFSGSWMGQLSVSSTSASVSGSAAGQQTVH